MPESEKESITTAGVRVQRRTLPDYATADFWEAVQMWRDWKTFGYEDAGGKNDQGWLWTTIVRTMNDCAAEMKAE